MSNDVDGNGPADAARIDMQDEYAVKYWTSKFRCTRNQLEAAVHAVGTRASDVQTCIRTVNAVPDTGDSTA